MPMLLVILILLLCAGLIAWSAVRHAGRSGRKAAAAAGAALLSVCAGIFLFWLIETAAERHVFGPGELFRFAGETGPLPGRAALLLACLCLSLGAGLAPAGERARAALERAARRNGVLWLVSAAVAALFFAWAMRITVVSFMTNDDTVLLKTFARIPERGLDYAAGSFSNILFCAFMSLFYRIDPEGWWYAGYHLAMIYIACTVMGRCILLKARRRGWPVLPGCLIQFVLCAGVFLPELAQLSFTVTPAAAGAAACALILCRDECRGAAARAVSDTASVVLMLLCYLQRRESGVCLLAFFVLAVAYQCGKALLAREPGRRRRLVGLGLAAAAVLGLCSVGYRINYSDEVVAVEDEYYTAEYYRSIVMDYLADDLTNEQLAEVGIPPELGNLLLRQWFFMDERINTETFRTLAQRYYRPGVTTADADQGGVRSSLLGSFRDEPEAVTPILLLAGALTALLLICAAELIRFGRGYLPELLCALCAFGGALIICLYLMIKGRFMYRTFLVTAIPAAIMIVLCALAAPEKTEAPRARRVISVSAAVAFVLAACVLLGGVVCHVPYAAEYADRETVFGIQRQTESYAREHSDLTFVTNFTSQNLDPFHGGSYPTNMALWGGTGVTASSDRMYADAFFREDVRFMCELPGVVMLLMQYLTLDHGPVAALDEAHLTDNIYVFDMLQIRPDGGEDGWYEWNGWRYYFRDGQALTGTYVIDGTEYTFAAPGAQAPMIPVSAGDQSYFTTTAYSLMNAG